MKVQAIKETTVWDVKDLNIPANTYFVYKDKLVAYIKEGSEDIIPVKGKDGNGMRFDKRGRTFKKVPGLTYEVQ